MTVALQLELLGGRYVATAYNDRAESEWPPHPARLFSALVEAWATAEPGSEAGERERMALIWLERQPAPRIAASPLSEVGRRTAATVFVPVNDTAIVRDPDGARAKLEAAAEAALGDDAKAAAKAHKDLEKLSKKLAEETRKATAVPAKFSDADLTAAARLQPEQRARQPRMFPSVTPADPVVTFLWEGEPEAPLRAALDGLARRVTRLGHSSSLVFARLVEVAGPARYVPDADGELVLRTVERGQMDRLIAAHHHHQGVESRVLPCTFERYSEGDDTERQPLARSLFSPDWLVFARRSGPRLPSTSAAGLAHQLRRALFRGHAAPMSERLSGHRADGGALAGEHLAVVPLPDVGGPHSHGGILGVALVPPRDLSPEERTSMLRAVGALERLYREKHGKEDDLPALELLLGEPGALVLERVQWGESRQVGLRPGTWCRPSQAWATATPIALDRNPGDLHHADPSKRAKAFEEAERLVTESLRHIGLPAPLDVQVLRSCALPGTEKPNRFPRYPISKDRPQRVLVHARILFGEFVRGPVLLGAGRYAGLGLLRPVDELPEGGKR